MGGSNGKEGEHDDVLLRIDVGANEQGDPVIVVSSAKDMRTIMVLNVPRLIIQSYIDDQTVKITPLRALQSILITSFDAILDSIAEHVDVDKKK